MSNVPFDAGRTRVGFVGLGQMGLPMVKRLLDAGFEVTAFDLRSEAREAAAELGAGLADGVDSLLASADVVLTSLPSSAVWVKVAQDEFLPAARAGQVFLDMGTSAGEDVRRLAEAFAARDATLLDCPVSGSPASGYMRIFIGGDQAVAQRCRPIFAALTQPELAVYCGPASSGQAVKGVNQLAMGLVDAAYLEAIAYGVRCGVDPAAIAQAVGGSDGFRAKVAQIARMAAEGRANDQYIKFPELPYFLAEARTRGFALPMTAALHAFCDPGPRNWVDNMNRPRVAYWHQLINAQGDKPPTE